MGIEYRRGRPYFYRKVRRGGRVVSEYAGGGALGQCLSLMAEADRIDRDGLAELWRMERRRMEDEERAFADYFDRVEAVAREALAAAGYHHHKGQWRKRRAQGNEATRSE